MLKHLFIKISAPPCSLPRPGDNPSVLHGGRDKDGLHINSGIPLSHEKGRKTAAVPTGMDPESVLLSDVSQTEKDRTLCAHSYADIKPKANNKFMDTDHRGSLPDGKGWGSERVKWGQVHGEERRLESEWQAHGAGYR